MSDALTPDAPAEVSAAPEAPVAASEVEGASAGATPLDVVPADRFNGLMSRYNADKADWEKRINAMNVELESLRNTTQEQPDVSDDGLREQVGELTRMLMEERQGNARAAALADFPDAAPFADLIVGSSPEEMRAVAQTLHERMQLLKGEGSGEPAPATPAPSGETAPPASAAGTEAPPAAPEHGGGTTVPAETSLWDAKEEAIRNQDFQGFLNASWALQNANESLV